MYEKKESISGRKAVEHNSRVNEICTDSSNNYLFVGSITKNNQIKTIQVTNLWETELKIQNKIIKLKIDTGAMANVLPLNIFEVLELSKDIIKNTQVRLQSYTGGSLNVIGKCILSCYKNNVITDLEFYVVNSNTPAILDLNSSVQLNLIKKIESIENESDYSKLVDKFKEIFTGIGCIKSISI